MAAQPITRFKDITPNGDILEVVVWKVPAPVPPTEHGYKYSAVYVVGGVRVVGFDNERGKGDHCHLDGSEVPYTFTSVEQLIRARQTSPFRAGSRARTAKLSFSVAFAAALCTGE